MALSNGPNLGLLVNGDSGEAHYAELMKLWRGLDLLVQPVVIDKDLSAPPGGPADGAAYIVGAAATGAWATKEKKIARYSTVAAAWEFYTPHEGWEVYVADEDLRYRYDGAAWAAVSTGGGGGSIPDHTLVERAANQSIPSATWTLVSWDTETADAPGAWASGSASRITVPSGMTKMRISYGLAWANSSVGNRYAIVKKNGADYGLLEIKAAQNEAGMGRASGWLTVTAGDYFELSVHQTSGGALNLSGNGFGGASWLQAEFA